MANKPTRGVRMSNSFVFRCSASDRAAIQLEAQKRGISGSSLVRNLLIKEKIIDPITTDF